MTWKAAFAIFASCVMLGCKAPTPEFDPFAGYGSQRVPPPATGAYGRPDAYYPGGQTAPASIQGAGNAGPLNSQAVGSGVALASNEQPMWRPAGATQTQQAVHFSPSGLNQASTAAASSLNLGGMHINDATNVISATAPAVSNQRVIQFNQNPMVGYPQSPYGQQQYVQPQQYAQPQYVQPQYVQPTPQSPIVLAPQANGTIYAAPGLLPATEARPMEQAPTTSSGAAWQTRYPSES